MEFRYKVKSTDDTSIKIYNQTKTDYNLDRPYNRKREKSIYKLMT